MTSSAWRGGAAGKAAEWAAGGVLSAARFGSSARAIHADAATWAAARPGRRVMSAWWRGVLAGVVLMGLGVAGSGSAVAQPDRRQNEPGQFDFYVLSLSWSPSWCAAAAERRDGRERDGRDRDGRNRSDPDRERGGTERSDPQCGARPFSFVVHGLWPQYERGFPEYCQVPAPRLNREQVSAMLDLMPSPRLVFHQWDKHGVCSGLSARAYFETVRKARAVIKIPEIYHEPADPLTVTPDEIEEAFVRANPGLPRTGIAVGCSRNRLSEVRICLNRELGFRDCPEVDRRACRRERLTMPPVRGG